MDKKVKWSGSPVFLDPYMKITGWIVWPTAILLLVGGIINYNFQVKYGGAVWAGILTLLPGVIMILVMLGKIIKALKPAKDMVYKITSTKLIVPGWRGFYERGYPRHRRLITPEPRGTYREFPLKDIYKVETEQNAKDKIHNTANIIVYLPSTIYAKGSGQERVQILEHLKDWKKVVKLLKK